MENKIHLHFRWVHLVGYLLLFLGDLGAFFVLRSYFLLMTAVVIVLVGILSVYGMFYLAGNQQVRLYIYGQNVVLGDETELQVSLLHRVRYFALNCMLAMEAENVFRESKSLWEISMPVQPGGVSKAVLPLKAEYLGKYHISCKEGKLRDLLGIVEAVIPAESYCEITVLPDISGEKGVDTSGFLSGMSESEESREKGHDFSEVHDIREYIPGDKLRDIHWKISAKQGELMVKERISVSGSQMVLRIALSQEKDISELLLQSAGNVAASFVGQNLPVCLLIWNGHRYAFDAFHCSDIEELRRALGLILAMPLSVRLNDQQTVYLKNSYPFLRTYLSIENEDSGIQVVMRENG